MNKKPTTEVVPKAVSKLADDIERGKTFIGGRRSGRTWALQIATAKPHQKQLEDKGGNLQ